LGGGITIDGFISGAVSKKMGLTVESVKSETGERTYRITRGRTSQCEKAVLKKRRLFLVYDLPIFGG